MTRTWAEVRAQANLPVLVCANCGERVYRTPQGQWRHCYFPSAQRCKNGKRVMGKKD